MKQKMMNSKIGKFVRRIVGEESGAVMMEYVIVAVLVAAAAVVAIAFFGQTITNQASSAASATAGLSSQSATEHDKAVNTANAAKDKAEEHAKKFSDLKAE